MKRHEIIIASTIGTVSAIAIGYLGVQIFGRNTMYWLGSSIFTVGAGAGLTQVVSTKKHGTIVHKR